MRGALLACVAVAALSLLVPAAPGYDAWAWLHWGREVAHLELSTAEGPAFKPLPVAICALLSVFGDAAAELWLVVARAGAAAALVLAFLALRGWAGVAAALGVALTGGFFLRAGVGDAEPLMLALALAAFLRARADAHGQALALAAGAALLRPEVWPFLGLYGLWLWRERPPLRGPLVALAAAIPTAWFLPEWAGSGELLRSTDRALVPNAGQPALADRPALESLERSLGLLFVPLALAALAVRERGPALIAGAGVAWIVLVALMAEVGFSGEERYAMPGAALIAVGGAAALARFPRVVMVVAIVAFAAVRVADVAELGSRLAHGERLAGGFERAIAAAGGRDAVLSCGRPAVGRVRGTLAAYHLRVEKQRVRADGRPGAVTLSSRLRAGGPLEPTVAAPVVAETGGWRVVSRCAR